MADLSPSKKKPIGGHGGVGGSVIVEASRFVKDLTMNTYNYKGERYGHGAGCAGSHGGTTGQHPSCQGVVTLPRSSVHRGEDAVGRGLNGRQGRDRIIRVPLGTLVKEVTRVGACQCVYVRMAGLGWRLLLFVTCACARCVLPPPPTPVPSLHFCGWTGVR